jgi:hypothetical protein
MDKDLITEKVHGCTPLLVAQHHVTFSPEKHTEIQSEERNEIANFEVIQSMSFPRETDCSMRARNSWDRVLGLEYGKRGERGIKI